MHRSCTRSGFLLLALGFLFIAGPAHAVIEKPLPLKEILKFTPHIFIAKVEKLTPGTDKATMILKVDEVLSKQKPDYDKLKVFLEGTKESQEKKELPDLLKRLAPDVPLVVFVTRLPDKKYMGILFTNGTWFQLHNGDPASTPWQFQSLEPYLRRTFAGTTADLRQIAIDGLAGKKDPPAWNKDEKPGVGPELKDVPKKTGARMTTGPVLGVIPTVAIGGPLAILSMLFPTLFGKPKEVMQRYLALLTVSSINSIVYLLHIWLAEYTWFRTSLVGSPAVLWSFMTATTLLGVIWARRRHQEAVSTGQAETRIPQRGEEIVYQMLSLAGLAVVFYAWGAGCLMQTGWVEFLLVSAAIWAGTLGVLYLRWATQRWQATQPANESDSAIPLGSPRPTFNLEGVMLAALSVVCFGIAAMYFTPRTEAVDPVALDPSLVKDELSPKQDGGVALFKTEDPGSIDSTPLVTEDRIYTAVAHRAGFNAFGRIHCIDRKTAKVFWTFDNDGTLKQVFSSPCLADNRLYIGEGYHQDSYCKMFCLDATTGKKIWEFPTKSHTESSPCVADGKVFFGAGDDGVYCVDARDGKEIWHFPGLHVDTNPTVVGNRLYGGSAYGSQYWMFCLDTATGNPIWRQPSKLPVFGSPTILAGQVFYGTGNGNMVQSDSQPAGALLCLKTDTGELLWKYETPDSILAKPAVDRRHVFFGSRDHNMYCISRTDGKLVWKEHLGSPVVAAPALLTSEQGESYSLYAASSGGRVCCLDPLTGKHLYQPFEVGQQSGKKPQLISSPRVLVRRDATEERRKIYFGVGLEDKEGWTAALYFVGDRFPLPARVEASVVRTQGKATTDD